jgi:3-hydroxymyristoyl/3-hydroxydecanoyl-(acyl carrier protein) dehydratase
VKSHQRPLIRQKTTTADGCRYALEIPPDLIFFTGHFNEFPLVPGVVQLQWAVEFAQEDLGITCSGSVDKLKFTRPIRPGELLELTLRRLPSGRLAFAYQDAEYLYSQGELHE